MGPSHREPDLIDITRSEGVEVGFHSGLDWALGEQVA